MKGSTKNIVLLLDAMGVIYSVGDDVGELLVPFVQERHGCADRGMIEENYRAASLGEIDEDSFWRAMGLDPSVEDTYLERLALTPELKSFLDRAQKRTKAIACLSNDVSRWSGKLRKKHGLEKWIKNWIVSGDVGLRKPSPEIYRLCVDRLGVEPRKIWFIDDRVQNLDSATEIGMSTILFDRSKKMPATDHRIVHNFAQILDLLPS